MNTLNQTAKARLAAKVQKFINDNQNDGSVSVQGNVFSAMDTLEEVKALTVVQAYKLEKAIIEAEYYDPAKDKYGFGPRVISPLDIMAFA